MKEGLFWLKHEGSQSKTGHDSWVQPCGMTGGWQCRASVKVQGCRMEGEQRTSSELVTDTYGPVP